MKCSKCGSFESRVNNSIKRNGTGTNQKVRHRLYGGLVLVLVVQSFLQENTQHKV